MIATNEYLNNSLILCCGHETDDISILDRVTMVYTKLFLIISTHLEGEVYDVSPLPTIDEANNEWSFNNYISLGLAQNIITVH